MFGVKKDVLWVAGAQFFALLNNFLLLKILTVNLSVSEYGYYALWMSILLFIRQIVYDPVSIISAKESKEDNFLGIDKLSSFQITRYLTDRLLVSALLLGLLSIFAEAIFHRDVAVSGYILFGTIYLCSNGAQGIALNILNILKKRKWASAGTAADSFIKVILVYSALVLLENELNSALYAVALSSFLVFIWVRNISGKFYTPISLSLNEHIAVSKSLLLLSLPLFLPTLLIALKGLGDKLFMAAFIGVEELAAYNVLLQLGFMPMILIIGIFQTYLSPDIYKATSLGKVNQIDSVAQIKVLVFKLVMASIPAIIFAHILSETVFSLVVGEEYLVYSKYLPIFVVAGTCAGISGILNVGVIGAFKSKTVGLLMLLSVSLGLIIQMTFIVIYGFEGGVIGLIFSNLMLAFVFGISLRFISFEK